MKTTKERQPWQLKGSDFNRKKAHADENERFQLFFEYLRISPSYWLACTCKDANELAKCMGDSQHAAAVWKTYADVGNVFGMLYTDWWRSRGFALFGVKSARPRVESVSRLSNTNTAEDVSATINNELGQFLQTRFTDQGKPDSLLVSIPLGLTRVPMLKQLKKILDEINPETIKAAKRIRKLETNKMRSSRLWLGIRLAYMKAARPHGELWRAAARAKISKTHHTLDPNAKKKTANTDEARRMMTIMASRLLHDSLVVAENAARGKFPSLDPVATIPFDFEALGLRLKEVSKLENARKAQLLAKKKAQAQQTVV